MGKFLWTVVKANDKIFNQLLKTHKEVFTTSENAYSDLLIIIDRIRKSVVLEFPEETETHEISNDYAFYRVAERLLNCTLNYINYDRKNNIS